MEARFDQRYYTRASRRRWQALQDAGPTIERNAAEILASPQIRIAIVPLGSTLKGYASRSSDVEYTISILDGLAAESGVADAPLIADPAWREAIFNASDEALQRAGVEPEHMGMEILSHIFIYNTLLSEDEILPLSQRSSIKTEFVFMYPDCSCQPHMAILIYSHERGRGWLVHF